MLQEIITMESNNVLLYHPSNNLAASRQHRPCVAVVKRIQLGEDASNTLFRWLGMWSQVNIALTKIVHIHTDQRLSRFLILNGSDMKSVLGPMRGISIVFPVVVRQLRQFQDAKPDNVEEFSCKSCALTVIFQNMHYIKAVLLFLPSRSWLLGFR